MIAEHRGPLPKPRAQRCASGARGPRESGPYIGQVHAVAHLGLGYVAPIDLEAARDAVPFAQQEFENAPHLGFAVPDQFRSPECERHPAARPDGFRTDDQRAEQPVEGFGVERIAPAARKACSSSRSVSDSGAVSVEACMRERRAGEVTQFTRSQPRLLCDDCPVGALRAVREYPALTGNGDVLRVIVQIVRQSR